MKHPLHPPMRAWLAGGLALACSMAAAADGGGCASSPAAGARTLPLPREAAAYGTMQHAALPLAADEVVITFDDGPRAGSTERVLAALQQHGAPATFFMLGEALRREPALARAVCAAGHSVAMHSDTHPDFSRLDAAAQRAELAAVQQSFQQVLGLRPAAWRYPYLAESEVMRELLREQRITVLSADVGIEDWEPASAAALTERLMQRLAQRRQEGKGGGIILLHDVQDRTADALPQMLQALKAANWRFVALRWAD